MFLFLENLVTSSIIKKNNNNNLGQASQADSWGMTWDSITRRAADRQQILGVWYETASTDGLQTDSRFLGYDMGQNQQTSCRSTTDSWGTTWDSITRRATDRQQILWVWHGTASPDGLQTDNRFFGYDMGQHHQTGYRPTTDSWGMTWDSITRRAADRRQILGVWHGTASPDGLQTDDRFLGYDMGQHHQTGCRPTTDSWVITWDSITRRATDRRQRRCPVKAFCVSTRRKRSGRHCIAKGYK